MLTINQKEEYYLLLKHKELLLKKEFCKKSLMALYELCGFQKNVNNFITLGNFHHNLCKTIETTRIKFARRLFLIPRGHLKTTFITNIDIIQRILNNSNIRILLVSSTLSNAKENLKIIKNIFWHAKEFRELFSEFCPPEDAKEYGTQEEFTVLNRTNLTLRENTLEAAGVGKEITGRHYDVIKFTDIVTDQTVNTLAQINKTIDYVKFAISLLDDPVGGNIDVEGTTYDYRDIHMVWKKLAEQDKKIFLLYAPVKNLGNGYESPFCEKFSPEGLSEIRKEQGSAIFSSQYLLEPIDEDDAPFKKNQIQYIDKINLPKPRPPCFTTVDPAISESERADMTCITTAFFDSDGNLFVFDIQKGHFSTTKTLDIIFKIHRNYKPDSIGIESVAFSKLYFYIISEKEKETNECLPIEKLERNTMRSKSYRIMQLQPYFENKKIFFCSDLDKEYIEDIILRWRPLKRSQEDDLLDTLSDLFQIASIPDKTENNVVKTDFSDWTEWLESDNQEKDAFLERRENEYINMG